MKKVINNKRYDTEKAMCIADDEFANGTNRDNTGRNSYLYKTPKGNYFAVYTTCWQGEHDRLEPLGLKEALELYEGLENQVEFERAFPTAIIEDA